MIASRRLIPPGPTAKYDPTQDLLSWMSNCSEEFGDIYKAEVYDTSVYVVSHPKYAQHVLRKNWRNYSKGMAIKRIRMLLGNGLMVSEGEFWKSQRRMVQPAFHCNTVDAVTDVITTASVALLDKWERSARVKKSVNVTRDISRMVLDVVLTWIFSDDAVEVGPSFRILSDESARDLRFAQEFSSLAKLVSQVAARRLKKRSPATDLLGMLMHARDRKTGEVMRERQLVAEIMTLIVAGHETTASTLNFIWYLLSQNQDAEEKLFQELSSLRSPPRLYQEELPGFSYTRQVIDEALRLYPPGWLMTRRALEDDWLEEYFVPAGTEIYISPYLIHRNPTLWDAPDRFDPSRFGPDQSRGRHELAMLPFSIGPRNCIGEHFARAEMQIHLMKTAQRLRLLYVGTDPPELEAGVNLRAKDDFIMIPEVRRVPATRPRSAAKT
jgi:cytochrome P450